MHIPRCLHIVEDVILQVAHRLQRVWHLLVLLNLPNHFRRFRPLGEIDEVGLLDDRRDPVFNEGQVGKVDAC